MKLFNIIAVSAFALTSLVASAETTPQIHGRDNAVSKYSFKSVASRELGSEINGRTSGCMQSITCRPLNSSRADEDYVPAGVKILRSTEFSTEIFQTGKEGKPDLYAKLEEPNIEEKEDLYPHPVWFNLKPECFEDGEIWGGHNIYPAGGVGCLFNKKSYGVNESNIIVPVMDASEDGYEGIVHIQFKARAESAGAFIIAEAVDVSEWANDWNIMGQAMTEVPSDEWHVFEAMFYGGNTTVMCNLYNASGISIYIDDIKVFQAGQPAQTPKLLPATNYEGETWTANWEPALGAEGYLLNVYSTTVTYDETSGQVSDKQYHFLYANEPCTETHFDVTGAESGLKYFYTVRSYRGKPGHEDYYESMSQIDPMVVNQLVGTQLHPVTDLSKDGYTASWDEIPNAGAYNYWGRFERIAEEDGVMVITEDDFTGVVDRNGFESNLTKENPDQHTYERFYYNNRLDNATSTYHKAHQPGWKGTWTMPYKDYLCFDAWQYIYGNGDAGYQSPELDLSKDGGKFTVSFDVAANLFEMTDEETGEYISGYPRVCVAIFNYHPELGHFQQDELQYFNNVKFNWKKATFNMTTGCERSIIGIYAVYAPENLYIDNLKVTQNYKKGEMLMDVFWHESNYTEGTTLEVGTPAHVHGTKLYHQVCGVKAERVEDDLMQRIDELKSPMTPLEMVAGSDQWSGIEAPTFSAATMQVISDNVILVLNPDAENVSVVDLAGRVVYNNVSGNTRQEINLASGNYIVKVGSRVVKLAL